MLARGILGSGRTCGVSFRPFPNSSGWWWLISSVFLVRIPCHNTTHTNGYYGAWPGWAVSISVLPLTVPWSLKPYVSLFLGLELSLVPQEPARPRTEGSRDVLNDMLGHGFSLSLGLSWFT